MKRSAFLITLMLLAGTLHAASITLIVDLDKTWPAGTTVRFYEKSGTTYTLQSEVTTPTVQATFTVIPGPHSYVARAYSNPWESGDSNVVTTPAVPNAPTNHRILTVVLAGVAAAGILLWALIKKIF